MTDNKQRPQAGEEKRQGQQDKMNPADKNPSGENWNQKQDKNPQR